MNEYERSLPLTQLSELLEPFLEPLRTFQLHLEPELLALRALGTRLSAEYEQILRNSGVSEELVNLNERRA